MFGKKKEEPEPEQEEKKQEPVESGNPKVDMELTRIKAQLEGFGELRKSNSERFSRISEQIGELRGMIMDTNKSVGTIEVKATKASDLVSSVQPEKLMIDVQKIDGKVEGLKANIDSNDTIMKDIMKNLKEMRQQMNFYKGIDQVVKLNEEVKKELMEVKKVEAEAKRHADRIDTIFIEFNKKFSDFEKFDSAVKEIRSSTKKLEADFDKAKVKLEQKEDKKEFEKLLDKFHQFEKHTTSILNLLDSRSKEAKASMMNDFNTMKSRVAEKFEIDTKAEEKKPGMFSKIFKKESKTDEQKTEQKSEQTEPETQTS